MTQSDAGPTGTTFLVVDDDALIAMDMAGLLAGLGHRALEAYSGAEALAIIAGGERVDALITDYRMPGMTGLELADKARALRPGLPVMLATGYGELPEAGEADYPRIGKPFDERRLAALIAATLPPNGPGVPSA